MADEPNPESAIPDIAVEDDRLIRETGTDARVAAIVIPILRPMGFRLVRVRLSGQNGLTLQIMAERDDGTIDVEGCEEISRAISPTLDVEDPIEKAYHLEVSSPGIDRPLVRKVDFEAAVGHAAKIETSVMVGNKKRFRGKITAVDADSFTLERDLASYGDEPSVQIPFDVLEDARLILTDALIRDALAKDNREKKAARRGDDEAFDDEADADEGDQDTENVAENKPVTRGRTKTGK
ncbi:ribosome maturation factor RimP [Tianweitania sp. BSSL-BM11]|uniref:Ribosome maturation factor RimP n=1 Tax=Tianweitania aestuarii TaxID=2814886 RepID=A0ABS5RSL6_9HYPH|nr:ribosome maturation factor RimP [Tianweitania aestuarii]MBS9719219.1 ribosome maturation factor RimP [Tianweitania aestuarii]